MEIITNMNLYSVETTQSIVERDNMHIKSTIEKDNYTRTNVIYHSDKN